MTIAVPDITARYFLSPAGVQTARIANVPGKGHFDAARLECDRLGIAYSADTDLYQQMFRLRYARVRESSTHVYVDAPFTLTKSQKVFLEDKHFEAGKTVALNDRAFIESRDAATTLSARQIVDQVLG